MGQRIDQFCEDLRLKLTNIDNTLRALKARIDAKADKADEDVRDHLGKVRERIEQDRAKVAEAKVTVKNWGDAEKSATREKIADWKSRREVAKLQNRADIAESYAAAALDIAVAAVDDAEQAALEAWLARVDADAALAG